MLRTGGCKARGCTPAMQGVCHRDLKLENTLLDGNPAPRLKICDFGYSKVGGRAAAGWKGQRHGVGGLFWGRFMDGSLGVAHACTSCKCNTRPITTPDRTCALLPAWLLLLLLLPRSQHSIPSPSQQSGRQPTSPQKSCRCVHSLQHHRRLLAPAQAHGGHAVVQGNSRVQGLVKPWQPGSWAEFPAARCCGTAVTGVILCRSAPLPGSCTAAWGEGVWWYCSYAHPQSGFLGLLGPGGRTSSALGAGRSRPPTLQQPTALSWHKQPPCPQPS